MQIQIHQAIDRLLSFSVIKADSRSLSGLIDNNIDAKQYFFSKADESWLDWLWTNHFLDCIKATAENPAQYGYQLPELNYLARIAKKVPEKIANIILEIPVSATAYNPTVLDRFLSICSSLPVDQLARVVPKIRDEKWIPLMGATSYWVGELETMLKKLADANDYQNILVLADAILAVRSKEEINQAKDRYPADTPFFLNDLSDTKVFEQLCGLPEVYVEKAFDLTAGTLARIVELGDRPDQDEPFQFSDNYRLFDVDFFSLELGGRRYSHTDDVRELAAAMKILAVRAIGRKCAEKDAIKQVFKRNVAALPESMLTWRFRLFVMSLCPDVFRAELKKAFFRLFEVKQWRWIKAGAEYDRALQKGFDILSDAEQREYVRTALDFFGNPSRDIEDKELRMPHGSRIFSAIASRLTAEEKETVEKSGFKIIANYKPEPIVGQVTSGFVRPRAPITPEELGKMGVPEIVGRLKTDWSPKQLNKRDTDDFLSPISSDGMAAVLKGDISQRLPEYLINAKLFFDPAGLDQHYTYTFFRSLDEILRGDLPGAHETSWDMVIELCSAIMTAGKGKLLEQKNRERDLPVAWRADWKAVHSAMADVIQGLLREPGGKPRVDFTQYRSQILVVISYLFGYPDPKRSDEESGTASLTMSSPGAGEPMVGDPFSVAINSVRGRAFEAMAMFLYQDGKQFDKEASVKIAPDIKQLYERILADEDTRALMFLVGRHLPSFFFRDRDWLAGLLPQIFSTSAEKKRLYTAAWEGYLSNNLYEELFKHPEVQRLYERGLVLTDSDYPRQKHFIEPDEGMANHLALAFMFYRDVGMEHPLIRALWARGNLRQHTAFIRFLGRVFISGDNKNADELLKNDPASKRKLSELWEWLLNNCDKPELFSEFGLWVNHEKDIFPAATLAGYLKRTLEKSQGVLDWKLGIKRAIVTLAKQAPADTLDILRLYWLVGGVQGRNRIILLHVDSEWFEAFRILYGNPVTRDKTYSLIDDLIREGGAIFWNLKNILT